MVVDVGLLLDLEVRNDRILVQGRRNRNNVGRRRGGECRLMLERTLLLIGLPELGARRLGMFAWPLI